MYRFVVLAITVIWVTSCTSKFSGIMGATGGNQSASTGPIPSPTSTPLPLPSTPPPPPSTTGDNFPRLANLVIGGTQAYNSAFQTRAAKLHINIIGGGWETWEQGRGYTKQTVIASIKSQSKINSRVFQYVNLNEQPVPPTSSWFTTYQNQVQSMNWWVYNVGTSGSKAPSSYNSTWGVVNMTAAAPKSNGLGPYEWGAKYVNDEFHLGNCSYCVNKESPAPSLDGFFLDNIMMNPREDGDWNRTGSTQSQKDPTVDYNLRAGEKTFYDEMAKIWPTGIFMGNMAIDAGQDPSPLTGVLSGALDESAVGQSWSYETWAGSARMQAVYKTTYDSVGGNKWVVFGHNNVQSNGSDPTAFDSSGKPTSFTSAYQGMRYGITACLMGDGYYAATPSPAYEDQSTLWFDEWDGGGLGVGYLGQSTQTIQTTAWSNGVWKREYQNGVVLWNPKGNGAKTVSLAGLGNLKRLKGSQNPSVNSGATVTGGSVTLQDRDGIILLRY